MAVFVRLLLVLSLACICVCKVEEGLSHMAMAMGMTHRAMEMTHRADRVESKSDDGKDAAENILTGRERASLTQSERTDSVTMMNNLRRTVGSSNMPYMAYDVLGENEADSWTSLCNYDGTFDTPGYVNAYKHITSASKTVPTVITDIFKKFPREMSSTYMTGFGCDLNNCNYAIYEGVTYQDVQLTLCLFKGGSQYNESEVQYKLGEGCTECNSGSFWCDYGLCRADCTASDSCYCNSNCMNCADTDRTTCTCQCLQGWTGSRCETQSAVNATTPICSTTARVPKTLTTISLDNVASIDIRLPVLQLVFCAIMALFLSF